MTGATGERSADISDLAGMEEHLARTIDQTTDELAHAECFDDEQRSEIYVILQALRDDSTNHREMIRQLAENLREPRHHA